MASIVLVFKPVTPNGSDIAPDTGFAYHGFLLLQDDNGTYTDIARGGPESAGVGSSNVTGGDGSPGWGNVIANVEPYFQNMTGPASNDYFTNAQIAAL